MKTKKEINIELIKLEIELKEKALNFIPFILNMAKKFDGKIINKRFDSKLKEIDSSLYFETTYNSFIIKMFYFQNNFIIENGISHCLKDRYECIIHTSIKDGSNLDGVCQGGTFIFENFEKKIIKNKEYALEEIEVTKKTLSKLNEIEERKNKLEKEIERHNEEVDYITDQYLKLRIKVQ